MVRLLSTSPLQSALSFSLLEREFDPVSVIPLLLVDLILLLNSSICPVKFLVYLILYKVVLITLVCNNRTL